MLILIDNYDSFSYNLVQALAGMGADVRVFRNDVVTPEEIAGMKAEGIVISPGPGTPGDAGISVDLIRLLSGTTPILGVCLGLQCVGAAFGGAVGNAGRIMHGKTSAVRHDGSRLYRGIKNPFTAGRYHSLAVERSSVPAELTIDAESDDDGEIMGLRHQSHPTYGVQFHPESVLTPSGKKLIRNFLGIVGEYSGS
ncbi:MAG: aminodeoxychorismate/anthranilate synthase component II [Kiritimatiellia bacterium]